MSNIDIESFALSRLGDNFRFRKGQLEAIDSILDSFYEGINNTYILDAPVGSGKSIIALLVSDIIAQSRLSGYILASDLALFDQYKRDIDRSFPTIKSVKGADNYTCDINLSTFTYGDCKVKNLRSEQVAALPCASTCGYMVDRAQAARANVSLMTYAFALIQRNYVAPKLEEMDKKPPFGRRDFVICDEAHNINSIVQSHFSPKIDKFTIDKLDKFRSYLSKFGLFVPQANKDTLRKLFHSIFNETDNVKIFALLKEFELILVDYVSKSIQIKEKVASTMMLTGKLDTDSSHALSLVDYIKDLHCKFEDYNVIVAKAGLEKLIKNEQLNNTIVFNCVDESYLMNKHFHEQFGFKLFMSATPGPPESFMKNIGVTSANYTKIENQFDFEKSPILFYPGNKMTYNEKEKSLPKIAEIIANVAGDHQNDSGIIHSGSYDNSKKIYEALPKHVKSRVLMYSDSQEKTSMLREFLDGTNKILIGPSLLEGLDLAGDKSRFQIFAKVPFPNLSDKFVSAKMKIVDDWYDWQAISNILQGIGRSIRNEEDWAVTYFLDESFRDLLRRRRSYFPEEVRRRIKIISE